ncbi:MAG: T9SS type A sorting domain-containing protein [Melioribacteraceae bacterium]|nr:T9SS type A sorting domain-containing protein [Melioribacteraceae bacterium]
MKKYILLVLALCFASVQAQISITESDVALFYQQDYTFTTHVNNTLTSIDIGGIGQQVYDFSALTFDMTYNSQGKSVSSSPYLAEYPGTQYSLYYETVSQGIPAQSWLHTSIVGGKYQLNGIGTNTTVQGINTTIKVKYNPARVLYNLPITYNSTATISINGVTESITSFFGQNIVNSIPLISSEKYTVDGYGKLKTPDGKTLDCLRVRSEETHTVNGTTTTSISYGFITKTGEQVTVSFKEGVIANSGIVDVNNVSYSEGRGSATGIEEDFATMPNDFKLYQNYPNPFNPTTNITYALPKSGNVQLKVYDILGNEVADLVNGTKDAGFHTVNFNASNLASGMYIYSLRSEGININQKMLLMK